MAPPHPPIDSAKLYDLLQNVETFKEACTSLGYKCIPITAHTIQTLVTNYGITTAACVLAMMTCWLGYKAKKSLCITPVANAKLLQEQKERLESITKSMERIHARLERLQNQGVSVVLQTATGSSDNSEQALVKRHDRYVFLHLFPPRYELHVSNA